MPRRHRNTRKKSQSAASRKASTSARIVVEPRSTSGNVAPPDLRFECNICLDAVVRPVVTHCGHLFCWQCLYQWLEPGMTPTEREALLQGQEEEDEEEDDDNVDHRLIQRPSRSSRRVCPVCRDPCAVTMVVPVYVRDETIHSDNTLPAAPVRRPLPPRPTLFTSAVVAQLARIESQSGHSTYSTGRVESTEGSEGSVNYETLVESDTRMDGRTSGRPSKT